MTEGKPHILKSVYQFDNFVTGPSNRLAFAAARKVAENPGNVYNPLLIHGGVGLGKTHLMQAIGNAVALAQPGWNLVFLNGSQMSLEDLVAAEKSDLLLFDDLHLGLADSKMQIRLLPLFDRMVGSGRQIIVTTDITPQKIESIDQKLLSRLLGGLIIGLKEVDVNEKSLIISRKSRDRGVALSDETALIIASRVPSNIRELEGALNKVLLYASLTEGPLTKAVVDEALPPLQTPQAQAEPDPLVLSQPPAGDSPVGEFGDFISGLDHKVTALIDEQQDADQLRQGYKEKLFIWKMKGFNTFNIEKILEQDISIVTEAYEEYTRNIEKLINLQQEFGPLSARATPEQMEKIENLMFDPDKAEDLEVAIRSLAQKLSSPKTAPEAAPSVKKPEPPPEAIPPRPLPASPAGEKPALNKVASLSQEVEDGKGKSEPAPAHLGIIEETWPFLVERLMEDA
ncbi:MAG: hypothetical protein A2273_01015 [Candidatus Edwardsbacteria bacterium RifOxyA12_full_54_48]|uniref:AAA+ ATPase domain-containing protein n=1 Tax=Candidatus Edwardsbacteria bacterium GWF2_54_11 TaxID=1817851 RepID=A0A1F5R397_9BACT|nr:MAG: hypothetical protein A2502_10045 [Candidatus Edwardsbacteria bacterium RifOxyC12_full_54_24]OGF06819.1 MAG: hypothetical protein A2273_01015 [Candidatus Edwardsbacteria bacterium RifOxyA12_full_54_48]OGF08886.1 MAG: hypothetical protein A2024_01275 [Candidatus Edwardsbacteria bacterium GWF2_54_11]OGF10769.1 MAG: hypothetical protein A3K15_06380 [Candidatus Edwardsbacteria bacterium GWE2_54_12]OGJ18662.1 MAG: hypothetical protein A2349_06470 [Candidatus Edwardsbacteria bacterium RifOxyB1